MKLFKLAMAGKSLRHMHENSVVVARYANHYFSITSFRSEDLREELVVTGTEPAANVTKDSADSTKKSVNNSKSADRAKSTVNKTKSVVTTPKLSNNSVMQSENSADITFGIRFPEIDFTGRSSELDSLRNYFQGPTLPTSIQARVCVVAGIAGIGKTQLASKFIAENRSSYQTIIWINADSSQSINDSFKKLAKQINVRESDAKTEALSRFCDGNTLFVYDNVVTIESIEFALVGTKGEGPHVLITSAVEKWDDRIKVIELQPWIIIDATKFVTKRLTNSEDSQADKAELVNELRCVPLALRLATAYILYEQIRISDYLPAIKGQNPSGDYGTAIFVTSTIAIAAIQKNETRGIFATKILHIIAYFAPNDIPTEFLSYLFTCQEEENRKIDKIQRVEFASRLIANYAIVTFDREDSQLHLSIHRSIQEVLKCKLQGEKEGKPDEELVLEEAMKLISDLSTAFEIVAFVSHAALIFKSAKIYPDLVNKWSALPAIILLKLLKKYPDGANSDSYSSQQLKEHIQRIEFLQTQLPSLKEENSDIVTTLTELALQYLRKETDDTPQTSWKYAVPLIITGGVVAAAVGGTVLKQYVERATEGAVTKVVEKAAKATEIAVSTAITETHQKWIKGAATVAATAVIGGICAVTGINMS